MESWKKNANRSLAAALFQTVKLYYLFHISKPIPLLFPESLFLFFSFSFLTIIANKTYPHLCTE